MMILLMATLAGITGATVALTIDPLEEESEL